MMALAMMILSVLIMTVLIMTDPMPLMRSSPRGPGANAAQDCDQRCGQTGMGPIWKSGCGRHLLFTLLVRTGPIPPPYQIGG